MISVVPVLLRGAGGAAAGLLVLAATMAAAQPARRDLTAGADIQANLSAMPASAASAVGLPLRRVGEAVLPADGIGISGLILLALLAAVSIAWAFLRRRGMRASGFSSLKQLLGSQPDGVRVLQSVRLTPRASVHVIEWNGRQHLLACSEVAVAALAQREGPVAGPAPEGS